MLDKSSIVNAAQKYASKGQLDKAIAEWEKLLEEKKDGNIHNNIGDLYLRKGAESDAIEAFEKAAELFKKDGFFPKAIAIHKKILNIVPANVDSLIALAKLNADKGLVGNAVENYFKAAEVFQREGSAEKTVMVIEKIVQLSPTDIHTRKKIAELYMRCGHRERSAAEYAEIGETFLKKNDVAKALEYFNGAIEFDNENIEAHIGLGKLSEKEGDYEKAFDYLEQVLPFDPDNLDLLAAYARVALRIGNNEGARNALNVLVEADPLDLTSKKQLGNIYIEEGELEEAWEHILPCIEDATSNQNWQEAVELSEKFRELYPIPIGERIAGLHRSGDNNDALVDELANLASLYIGKENKEDALNLYRELLGLRPDDTEVAEKAKELERDLGIAPPQEEPATSAPELMSDNSGEPMDESFSEGTDMMADMLMSTQETLHPDSKMEPPEAEKSQMDDMLMSNELVTPEEIEHGKTGPHDNVSISPIEFSEKEAKADELVEQGQPEQAAVIYRELLSLFPGNEGITRKLNTLDLAPASADAANQAEESFQDNSDLDDIFSQFGSQESELEITTEKESESAVSGDALDDKAKEIPSPASAADSSSEKENLDDIFSQFSEDEPASETPAESAPAQDNLQDIFGQFSEDEPAPETPAESAPAQDNLQDIFGQFSEDEPAPETPAESASAQDDLQDIFGQFSEDEPAPETPAENAPAQDDLQDIFGQFDRDESAPETPAESAPAEGETKEDMKGDSDLEEIFDTFESKKEPIDYQARYSSALELKQQGRFDDAIREFRVAAEDPDKKLMSSSMVALCYMEQGDYPAAIGQFKDIIAELSPQDGSYLRMKYELAEAYKKTKDNSSALETYNEIQALDPDFKDVHQQIEELNAQSATPADKQPGVQPEKPKTKKNRVSYI